MSKETFKTFAREHPELADSVMKGKATWQQFYEIFEIYGENNSIWNQYIEKTSLVNQITTSASTWKDFMNTFKNLDMDSIQQGITNIQKTIGLIQDLGSSNRKESKYEAQPIYKRFED